MMSNLSRREARRRVIRLPPNRGLNRSESESPVRRGLHVQTLTFVTGDYSERVEGVPGQTDEAETVELIQPDQLSRLAGLLKQAGFADKE